MLRSNRYNFEISTLIFSRRQGAVFLDQNSQYSVYSIVIVRVILDAFPLQTNGKIDYQSLPVPVKTQSSVKSAYVTPRTLDEQKLARMWEDLLSIENLVINDNFFELGGHSILGMEMIAQAFNPDLKLTIKQLYQTPTIAAMLGEPIQF